MAAALTAAILFAAYRIYSSNLNPDWLGYEYLYSTGAGGWLARLGRDPLFAPLLAGARLTFGPNGYAAFRLALFAIFAFVGSAVAYCAPRQRAFAGFSPIVVALVVTAALLMKSLVQIREGVAFLCILGPLVGFIRSPGSRVALLGVGSAIAVLIHNGTVLLFPLWLAAAGSTWRPLRRMLTSRILQPLFLATGVALGLSLALVAMRDVTLLRFLLQDRGVDVSARVQGSGWKYAYWIANLGVALLIRWRLQRAAAAMPPPPRAYATLLGSFLIPALYVACASLVLASFYLPALTAMLERLLFTATELALLIIVLRGDADWMTLAITLALLAERIRLLAPPSI